MKKFKIGDLFKLSKEFDDFIYEYGKYFVIYEIDDCTSLEGKRVDYLFNCVGTRFKDFILSSEELEERLNKGFLEKSDVAVKCYEIEYYNESKGKNEYEHVLLPDSEEFRDLEDSYFELLICDSYHSIDECNKYSSSFERDSFKINSIKEIPYGKM